MSSIPRIISPSTSAKPEASITTADKRAYRLTSIDMIRGLVIVIMAIDHVRDNFFIGALQDPTTDPNITAGVFATRWITHFCAPVFVLLAGTSAGLMASRKSARELARFLFTRAAWLIFVEMVIISTAATFAPRGIPEIGGQVLIIMQVIWAIGASMIALSFLQWMGRRACLVLGLAIVAGHNLLDRFWPVTNLLDEHWPLWVSLHAQMAVRAGPFLLLFIYPILAWIGVMLLGFGVSEVFEWPQERRNRILLRAGIAMTSAFLLLRAFDGYGDPNHWQWQQAGLVKTMIDFLNTTKYPPSLLFLLMTLGPAAIVCGVADRATGAVKESLVMFGRVPFAFYVAHFYVIHTLSLILGKLQGFSFRQMMTVMLFYPKGYGVGLPGVYLAWILVIAILYPYCRWVAGVKARRQDWWLSYL
jgi:uncharacterized membrane protein